MRFKNNDRRSRDWEAFARAAQREQIDNRAILIVALVTVAAITGLVAHACLIARSFNLF